MVEDEETTTARFIADKVSMQLMVRYLFELLGSIDDDPDAFHASAKKQLLELATTVPLGQMNDGMKKAVRAIARENIDTLLTNARRN